MRPDKTHTFKLRSELHGQHVRTTVFAGYVVESGTLANCGTLTMNVGEWQTFGALLVAGAALTEGRTKVIVEGDQKIVDTVAEREKSGNESNQRLQCTTR